MQLLLKKIKIKQLGVNSSIIVTSYKLQGITKETIIVVRNEKKVKNQLHVVLSRVKKEIDFCTIKYYWMK